MSIQVKCPACGRTYQTNEQYAGRQVKCKACGTAMTVPQPAGAAAPVPNSQEYAIATPPPLPASYPPPPIATAFSAYPMLPPTAPSKRASTGIIIACVVGGLILVLGAAAFGIYSTLKRVRGPALFMSDATVSSSLVGTWTGTQSHPGQAPIWAELTFNPDGTGRMRFSGQGKVADIDTNWQVRTHAVRLTFANVKVGNTSSTGTSFVLGVVSDVGPNRLVMKTKYGDESYSRVGQPGAQPPAGYPRIPLVSSRLRSMVAPPNPSGSPTIATRSPPSPTTPAAAPPPRPPPPAEPAGDWQDLLANVNIAASTSGEWRQDNGALAGTSTRGYARLPLAPPPAPSFELEVTFNRESGNKEFCILFPAAGAAGELKVGALDGQWGLLRGGNSIHANQPLIVNGTDQVLRLTVQPDRGNVAVQATVDGKPLITWNGSASRLRASPSDATDPAQVGVAVSQGTRVSFKQIRIRPLRPT